MNFESPLSNILEDESLPIRISNVSSSEIKLADGLVIPSPCIFLNGRVFLWKPPHIDPFKAMPNGKGWESWTNEIWTLFELVVPRPGMSLLTTNASEILILGTGKTVLPVPNSIKSYLNSLGIQLDVQNTVCSSS